MKSGKRKGLFYTSLVLIIAIVAVVLSLTDISSLRLNDMLAMGGGGSNNYYSTQNGNWNSSSSWSGSKPSSTIAEGDTIFVNHNVDFSNHLTVNGVIIIASGKELNSNGSKNINISSSGTLTSNGDFNCNDLTIAFDGSLSSYGNIFVYGNYNSSDTLIIETSDTTTGSILVNGSIIANKYIKFRRKINSDSWHYVASPIENASASTFSGGALYSYIEPSSSWNRHNATDTLTPMLGYDVYFKTTDKTIEFIGDFNHGAQSIDISRTESTGDGFNLIGNPFPAAIDWDAGSGWTKTSVDNAVYIWDAASQNITSYINGLGTNGGNNIIPPTMAFFIKCNNPIGGTLGLTNEVMVSNTANFRTASPSNIISLKIKSNDYSDETVVCFNQNATSFYDEQYDALKLFSYNKNVPQLHSRSEDNKDLSINTLSSGFDEIIVPILFTSRIGGDFKIECSLKDMDSPFDVFLEDRTDNKTADLKSASYTFSSGISENSERFFLHLIPVTGIDQQSTDISETDGSDILIFSREKNIFIESNQILSNAMVRVYSMNGQEILSQKLSEQKQNIIAMNAATGTYIVTISSNGKMQSQKVLLK